MKKTTLNPFENAKRTREEGGGVSPAVIEEMQAEISVLGSENASQAQDITDIKNQLTELASTYSTTEHKTGRKWADGKDIFERVLVVSNLQLENYSVITDTIDYIDNLITASAYAESTHAYTPLLVAIDSGSLKGKALAGFTADKVVIQYTKPTN